jgi:hypothetical protein
MRAPETNDVLGCDPLYEAIKEKYPFVTFSEAQWQEIRESLAERSVELETEMLQQAYADYDANASKRRAHRPSPTVSSASPVSPPIPSLTRLPAQDWRHTLHPEGNISRFLRTATIANCLS